MVFTSWEFVAFFLLVLLALRLMPNRWTRQLTILLASVCFYGYWNKWYLFLLATPSIIDYACSIRIEDSHNSHARKLWLWISIVTNLGLLGYFKYSNFFLDSCAGLLGTHFRKIAVLLPIGISFYTFKTMSYTIDVYRREIPACRSWWKYAMFVTYFPELIAGPIVRASVFLPQMTRSLRPSWPRAWVGLQLILLGVSKKRLVADRLAILSDSVFAHPSLFSPLTVISAVVAYSIQIYCDFSGYSDIAIGVSRMIGFDLPENFNMPYLATSVTEFWRRWHITLSQWLRDYLYIPLGGSRKGVLRTYLNLTLTMLIGGLWHGANWTFVVWGALHGAGLVVHKLWAGWKGPTGESKFRIPAPIAWLITYAFVCLAWIFFRSQDFATTIVILRKVAFLDRSGLQYTFLPLLMLLPVIAIAHGVGVYTARSIANGKRITEPRWVAKLYRSSHGRFAIRPHRKSGTYFLLPWPGFTGGFALTLWLLVLYLFSTARSSPFIYFQF
jgi:alginate O-acetyltransferase complex protein AlgI